MHFNAFIRHSHSVRMANIAQIVNVIAPVFTRPDSLFLQTIFHPFEVYASTCGNTALDVRWQGETFTGGEYKGVRVLDVSATLDESGKQLSVYVVNRNETEALETEIHLITGSFTGNVRVLTVNGPDIKSENSFNTPDEVTTRETTISAEGKLFPYTFEPHSVTALVADIS
jgi:alpha-N-arabinofuranosidase